MFSGTSPLKSRFLAAGIHLAISLAIALLAALLVFGVWYPYPYRDISGGRNLFLLVVGVDVVMGPLLTLAVFNRKKPIKELRRDIAMVGVLQLAALVYGLWTVAVARPVHLVYEIDRFRVVHAIDVPDELVASAPADLKKLPLTGPTLLSVRAFRDATESMNATMAALQGLPLGARPDLWQTYEVARPQVLATAKPLEDLKRRFPDRVAEIDAALRDVSSASGGRRIAYVPMAGRSTFWTVLIDASSAEVLAFVPVDSF
ncbi:MAG: TfpX/TfpZ family type IV pilin accessory protein [Polaromonas sp.]|nr:TfpX/TfpZ family type IV pilin accessory protein [Polaromonas sp.]